MNNSYEINKLRVQQFGLTATVKEYSGKEHYFHRGHEYVEIGGLKWAVTNIGAKKESDGGLYFAFGEAQGYTAEQVGGGSEHKFFGWKDYKYGNGTGSPSYSDMTKYNETDHKTVLEACDDAVQAAWGGSWRMPTEAEFRALLSSATHEWIENYQFSGVNGRLFTDKTDSSKKLFFPAVGGCDHGCVFSVGYFGYYRSSSLSAIRAASGRSLSINNRFHGMNDYSRNLGFSIRGVVGD